jgi:hypothetical protein
VQRRTAVVVSSWLLDVIVRLLLQLLHCSGEDSCRSMLLLDACMAATFVMYQMSFHLALPCCSGFWVACAALHHAAAPSATLSERAPQLLLQLLLPLAVLYAVQRRARLAYLSVLGRTQQQQVQHSDSVGSGSVSPGDTAGTSKAAVSRSAAGAAAEDVQATSDGRDVQVAAAAAHPQPVGDAAASATPTASLVYESPLLHRTVAIKVSSGTCWGCCERDCQTLLTCSAYIVHVPVHLQALVRSLRLYKILLRALLCDQGG